MITDLGHNILSSFNIIRLVIISVNVNQLFAIAMVYIGQTLDSIFSIPFLSVVHGFY